MSCFTLLIKGCLMAATLALVAPATAASAEIDFTPRYAETLADHVPVKRLHFLQDRQRIFLRPPVKWRVTGGRGGATFTPPSGEASFVRIQSSPMKAALPFDEASLAKYRAAAAALLPDGVASRRIEKETPDALPINDWQAHEFQFSYAIGGRRGQRSVLFITLDAERQIVVIADAPPEEFVRLQASARALIRTWHEEIDPAKVREIAAERAAAEKQ